MNGGSSPADVPASRAAAASLTNVSPLAWATAFTPAERRAVSTATSQCDSRIYIYWGQVDMKGTKKASLREEKPHQFRSDLSAGHRYRCSSLRKLPLPAGVGTAQAQSAPPVAGLRRAVPSTRLDELAAAGGHHSVVKQHLAPPARRLAGRWKHSIATRFLSRNLPTPLPPPGGFAWWLCLVALPGDRWSWTCERVRLGGTRTPCRIQ